MHNLFRVVLALVLVASLGSAAGVHAQAPDDDLDVKHRRYSPLVDAVKDATRPLRALEVAEASGYGLFHGCVSGPRGAMGVHFVNGDLVADPAVDLARPEALIYEWRGGKPRLVGVEYVVLADDWNAVNPAPPVLAGQLFHYTGAPNRYGIPAFYSLHVWAWKHNPDGVFADWNPNVTCAEYVGAP